MHEDGVGMAATFAQEFRGNASHALGTQAGFFASVDGAAGQGYRAPRLGSVNPNPPPGQSREPAPQPVTLSPRRRSTTGATNAGATNTASSQELPVGILTGGYGARVLAPLLHELAGEVAAEVRLISVPNRFFGGNIAVTGLMVGADVSAALASQPVGHRYLLPDVCLSGGVFLDGVAVADLPRTVEVVATDGISLRRALGITWTSGSDPAVARTTMSGSARSGVATHA